MKIKGVCGAVWTILAQKVRWTAKERICGLVWFGWLLEGWNWNPEWGRENRL